MSIGRKNWAGTNWMPEPAARKMKPAADFLFSRCAAGAGRLTDGSVSTLAPVFAAAFAGMNRTLPSW